MIDVINFPEKNFAVKLLDKIFQTRILYKSKNGSPFLRGQPFSRNISNTGLALTLFKFALKIAKLQEMGFAKLFYFLKLHLIKRQGSNISLRTFSYAFFISSKM